MTRRAKEEAFAAGFMGEASDVCTRAMKDMRWQNKVDLLNGCLEACAEGRPQNLRSFISGYLDFKKKSGYDAFIDNLGDIDDGFLNLLARPLVSLLEKSSTPDAVLQSLTQGMSSEYRQRALDCAFMTCCATGRLYAARVLQKAGAEVNAQTGGPLYLAIRGDNRDVVRFLHDVGADFTLMPPYAPALYDEVLKGHHTRVVQLAEKERSAAEALAKKKEEAARNLKTAGGRSGRFRL